MRFIHDKPCILIGKKLIVGDLHIGIESGFYKNGIKMPSQTKRMAERIIGIIKSYNISEVIFIGDIKHEVPGASFQEIREIPIFLKNISKHAKITIISGNHDGELEKITGKKFRIKKELKIGNSYLTHGHMWPSENFLECKSIIIGHEHPQIEFRDAIGYRFTEQVWVKAKLSWKRISEHYNLKEKVHIPELIIMPAFNHFSGGICLNEKYERVKRANGKPGLGPIARSADMKNAEIFLIDGTYLGKLKDLK